MSDLLAIGNIAVSVGLVALGWIIYRQTKQWLNYHGIPFHELHHLPEKKKFQKARGFDIFLEDNLEECEVLADHCERIFLFDHPWNRTQPTKKNIVRVQDWKELQRILSL